LYFRSESSGQWDDTFASEDEMDGPESGSPRHEKIDAVVTSNPEGQIAAGGTVQQQNEKDYYSYDEDDVRYISEYFFFLRTYSS